MKNLPVSKIYLDSILWVISKVERSIASVTNMRNDHVSPAINLFNPTFVSEISHIIRVCMGEDGNVAIISGVDTFPAVARIVGPNNPFELLILLLRSTSAGIP